MKKQEILDLIYELASPLAMVLAGLTLTFCPDAATAMISRLLGWVITLAGIGFGIAAIANRRKAVSLGVTSVGLVCIGGFLAAKPLALAAFIGKIIGLLVFLRGLRELMLSGRRNYGGLAALLVTVVGFVLILLPMTASRLVFSGCGVVLLAAGVWQLVEKFRHRRLPPDRPDIIDV